MVSLKIFNSDIFTIKNIEETKESVLFEDEDPGNEMTKGEFIFIIDRSGSMNGNRIKTAVKALKLFVHSIPPKSKFNIVSFGTNYEYMFEENREYNNENMKIALDELSDYKANFRGTQMLEPVKAVLENDIDNQLPRNIFVLTDGSIRNPEAVIKQVKEFCHNTRVHTFGVGSGADKYLIREMAKAGNGTATSLDDEDPTFQAKVISALNIASKPAYTFTNVSWKENEEYIDVWAPKAPFIPDTYEDESFNIYAILDEGSLKHSTVELSYFNSLKQHRERISLEFDPDAIIESEIGQDFHLAAKSSLNHFQSLSSNEKEQFKEDAIAASTTYSVLCPYTAFFGKIKNLQKSTKDMEVVEIPIKKIGRNRQRDTYGVSKSSSNANSNGFFSSLGSVIKNFWNKDEIEIVPHRFTQVGCAPAGSPLKLSDMFVYDQREVDLECISPKGGSLRKGLMSKRRRETDMWTKKKSISKDKELDSFKVSDDINSSTIKSKNSKDEYMEIARFQDSEGYFTDLPTNYASAKLSSVPDSLQKIISNTDDLLYVWKTILALSILYKYYKKDKAKWTLIAKKAESYLRSMGVKDYKQQVHNAIKLV